MPEYLISQRDPRGERSEQMAAVKAAYIYNMQYGFPVTAGPDDGNGPSGHWQLRAIEEQERIRLNLLALRRKGKWDFVKNSSRSRPASSPPWCTRPTSAGFWTTSCPCRVSARTPIGSLP
jgi:hypothetical protein